MDDLKNLGENVKREIDVTVNGGGSIDREIKRLRMDIKRINERLGSLEDSQGEIRIQHRDMKLGNFDVLVDRLEELMKGADIGELVHRLCLLEPESVSENKKKGTAIEKSLRFALQESIGEIVKHNKDASYLTDKDLLSDWMEL